MWPKSGTIIVFLWFTLTVTQSLAQTPCRRFNTVGNALQHYDLPAGLFPNNVQSFSCDPVSVPGTWDALHLVVRLRGHRPCTVTRVAVGVTNVITCQPQFSAVISHRQLLYIRGVTIRLTASSPPFGPLNLALVVDGVKVTQPSSSTKFVQFFDTRGIASPPFPIALIPNHPPRCDHINSAGAGAVDQAGDSQDIPSWASILPIVAA